MPKIYEYLGIIVSFYSNHKPIHVHGRYPGRESKAEIIIQDGRIVGIEISAVAGRRPLEGQKLKDFTELVEVRAEEIVTNG